MINSSVPFYYTVIFLRVDHKDAVYMLTIILVVGLVGNSRINGM